MNPDSGASGNAEFGRFTLLPHRRELLADGVAIDLGGRAFDVLLALIEARGTVLTKDELMRRVWPGRIVEENNLQAQIAALRKALGADRDLVRTVPGRGYLFTGELRAATVSAPAGPSSSPLNLATSVSELIGREAELREVTDLVRAHRLVTLTGAGGIGKTRLGLEVARQLVPAFDFGTWRAEGRCFQGVLLIKRGDLGSGLPLLRAAVEELPAINFSLRYTGLLGELAEALGRSGEVAEGLAVIDRALERSERNEERWCVAELCRVKGELVLLEGAQCPAAVAERHFQEGLDWARQQEARSWELRCATSLAVLWHRQGLASRARELLAPVYAWFTEGFETADLRAANALLGALQ